MWKGKFFAPWIENVNTVGSPRRIAAVPLPWCTSVSMTTTRSDEARGLDGAGGDGRVVEDAVALAPVGERVVRAAREVRGEALLQGGEAGA